MILREVFLTFFKIGAFSFGGGYAMLPLISAEVVDARNWLSMSEFIDVIAISQGTPGPIAINAATYVGYKVAGPLGSLVATSGVVLPSLIIMTILGSLFLRFRKLTAAQDMFSGIRPVVVALIARAAFSVLPSSVTGILSGVLAAGTVVAMVVFEANPIVLLAAAGVLGVIMYR